MRLSRDPSHGAKWILLLCFAPVMAFAQPALGAGVDSVFAEWTRPGSPGCVVGVSDQAGPSRFAAYGTAILEHKLANDTLTRFAAGSIAKPVTSLIIGTLVGAGQLSLDQDVRPLLTEIAHYPAAITVRQLLTHTSGVRDFRQLFAMSGWRREDAIVPADVSRILRRQRATSFPPGTDYLYSNSDYFLLAQLVERMAGQPFAQIARDRVFVPLGMNNTVFVDAPGQLVDNRAMGYGRRGSGWRLLFASEGIPGPGDLYTTAPDLLRFITSFDTPRVVGRPYFDMMQTPGRLAGGTPIDVMHTGESYGFGLSLSRLVGRTTIGHDGTVPGFAANMIWMPTDRRGLAILCNTWALDLAAVTEDVVRRLAGATAEPSPAAAPSRPAAEFIAPVAGVYQEPAMRVIYRVSAERDTIRLGRHALVARGDGSFDIADAQGTRVAFRTTRSGAPLLLLWNPGQTSPEVYELRRAGNDPVTMTERQLREYAGHWYSSELDFSYEFRVDKDRLALITPKWEADPEFFSARLRDVFVGESGAIVEFVRDASGQLTGFHTTVDRARGVVFVRSAPPPGLAR